MRLGDRQAEPVHAGVDVNGGAAGPAGAPAKHVPFGEFVEIADHGLGSRSWRRRRRSSGRNRRAHRWRPIGSASRAARASSSVATKNVLQPAPRQRPRHRFGAAAIGVGLDHGGAFGRHRGLLELAPVGDDGVEIDGEDAAWRSPALRPGWPRATAGAGAGSISGSETMFMPHFTRGRRGGSTVQAASVRPLRQWLSCGEIAEPRELAFELQFDRAGRAVALLADDDFGLAVHQRHVELPFLVFRRAGARLLVGEVIFLADTRTSPRRRPARSSRIRASRTVAGACRRGFRPDATTATAR